MTEQGRFHVFPLDPEFSVKSSRITANCNFRKGTNFLSICPFSRDGPCGDCHSSHERPPSGWHDWSICRCSAESSVPESESIQSSRGPCSRQLGTEIPYFQLTKPTFLKQKKRFKYFQYLNI